MEKTSKNFKIPKKCPKHKLVLRYDITKDFNYINKDYSLVCPKCNYEIIFTKG